VIKRRTLSSLFQAIDDTYRRDIDTILAKIMIFLVLLHLIDMGESYLFGYTDSLLWEILRIAVMLFVFIPNRLFGVGQKYLKYNVLFWPLVFFYGTLWIPDENYFLTLPWLLFMIVVPFFFFPKETAVKWAIFELVLMGIVVVLSALGVIETLYNTSLLVQVWGALGVTAYLLYNIESKRDIYKRNIQALANENQLLYDEMMHRTKNNLQFLLGLFEQEHRAHSTETCKELLKKLTNRVRSFDALNIVEINAKDGRVDLAEMLTRIVEIYRNDLSCDWEIDLDTMSVPHKQANYLALILNELLNNVQKHAYPAGANRVEISLKKHADDSLTLTVGDNGTQSSGTSAPNTTRVGTELIERLVRTLPEGSYETASQKGWKSTIRFALA
jgi:two-component sensor histidine kinase